MSLNLVPVLQTIATVLTLFVILIALISPLNVANTQVHIRANLEGMIL